MTYPITDRKAGLAKILVLAPGRRAVRLMLLTAALTALVCSPASATVILVTSGDASGGWVAPAAANVVIAGDAYANYGNDWHTNSTHGVPITENVQGVQFQSFRTDGYPRGTYPIPPGDSLTGADGSYPAVVFGYAGGGPAFPPISANDKQLENILSSFYYSTGGLITLTIGTGLTPGATYRMDAFVWTPDPNTYSMAVNTTSGGIGGTSASDSVSVTGASPYSPAQVVEQIVTVGTSGQLVTTFSGGAFNPRFSGFVVSSVPVPEPSTVMLACLGLVGLVVARRAVRRRSATTADKVA